MIRILSSRALRHLLHTTALARPEARTARRDLAAAHDRNRALVSHLARRDDVHFLPVLVPVNSDVQAPIHPLVVLLLCARLSQVAAERDAFRAWVTEDPRPASAEHLRARAAETASAQARKDML